MNYKMLFLEIFAILSCFIIIDLPFVQATNVKVLYTGGEQNIELAPEERITKSIDIHQTFSEVILKISISSLSEEDVIETIYIFKCGDLDPDECVKVKPYDSYTGGGEFEYNWKELANRVTGFPQTANILTFVQFRNIHGESWVGFWDKIIRTGYSNFSHTSPSLEEAELIPVSVDLVPHILNFIDFHTMLPFTWISNVVFPPASSLREVATREMSSFTTLEISGNKILEISDNYSFIFPIVSEEIYNPITFVTNPDYLIGDGNCETEKGETQANSCYDCGCSSYGTNYYCDIKLGCKNLENIKLSLYGKQYTAISNCRVTNKITLRVKVENAPTDMKIVTARYSLGGEDYHTTTCSNDGETYSCEITVPADPDCTEGEFRIGPNTLEMIITFPDGPQSATKTLTVQFPDIVVASWECGTNGCEEDVGEDSVTCCYDCGCPQGQYCDVPSGPDSGICKPIVTPSSILIRNIHPTSFSAHVPGDAVYFNTIIKNAPSNLHVEENCLMKCTCLLYTSPSPRDLSTSRMPSSA